MVGRSQKTVVAPVVEIPAHRGDRRKVVRQHPPLTARGGHVQYGVEHIAQIRRARAASGLRRGSNGAIWHHSSSVASLAYRRPLRSYLGRVISVHILCLLICFITNERITTD